MKTILTEELVELAKKRAEPFPIEGFLVGQGPVKPAFMLIGEAPGETEANNGVPFSGRAGKELMKMFDYLGVTREEVYMTSVFRSRPYHFKERISKSTQLPVLRKYNRAPTKKEIFAHAPLLDEELRKVKAPILLTMGNAGLQRLIGSQARVSSKHGKLYEGPVLMLSSLQSSAFSWSEKEYKIFPTFHPASIFYNRGLLEKIFQDLKEFKTLI